MMSESPRSTTATELPAEMRKRALLGRGESGTQPKRANGKRPGRGEERRRRTARAAA